MPQNNSVVAEYEVFKNGRNALAFFSLNDNWSFVQRDLTLVTIPDADHFVQQDAAELVSRTIRSWLSR